MEQAHRTQRLAWRSPAWLMALVLAAAGVPIVLAPHTAHALTSPCGTSGVFTPPSTCTYSASSAEDTFTVPSDVSSVAIVAVGGKGGFGSNRVYPPLSPGGPGGFGARVTGDVAVTSGTTLYIAVGGNGQNGCPWDCAGGVGGVHGGGGGGFAQVASGGGGGGASDIRTVSADAPSGSPASRLVVAGGGGGGGGAGVPFYDGVGAGGAGGSAGVNGSGGVGACCPPGPGLAGTATAPGAGGTTSIGGCTPVETCWLTRNGAAGNGASGGAGGVGNCPLVPNAAQTDTDSDGTGDACDSDDDGDGYSDLDEVAAGSDPLEAASTPEQCDGVDNDLDGATDEGFPDTNGDGAADCVDEDDDGDGIDDDVDTLPLVTSDRFSDVPLGGQTAGQVVTTPAGMTVTVSEAGPNPTGVYVTVEHVGGQVEADQHETRREALHDQARPR